jgi:flagellar hook-associated protein 1 FlgK
LTRRISSFEEICRSQEVIQVESSEKMSILNIAQSGLAAAQLGLSTTANNIANASTPGYNREQIVQSESLGQNSGSGFLGSGTDVQTIERLYNSFLATQQNVAQSSYSSLNTNFTQISQIDNMFASSTTGLSPSIQGFFNSVQTATAHPSSTSSLQTVLTSAQSLTAEFQSTSAQLNQLSQGVNTQLTSTVQSINGYATQIANLNNAIQTAEGSTAGQQPNDLLDERDQAVASLSKLVGVTVVQQGNQYNISIGTGQPMVVGTQAYQLTTLQSPTNASQLEVGYQTGAAVTQIPESSLSGGSISGLLQFRSQSLSLAENAVGQMAVGLANTVNAQQELGQDQNGRPGVAIFNVGGPVSTPSTTNSGTLQVTTSIGNTSALTTSDYSLEFDGANYNLTRLSDNTLVYQGAAFPPAAPVDGLNFTTNGGAPNPGDNFLIQPTAAAAAGMSVAISNTSQIAMAAPIVTNAPNTNVGTGVINAGVVNPLPVPAPVPQPVPPLFGNPAAFYPNLTDSVSITFNGAPSAGTYNVFDNTTATSLATNVAYVANSNISYNGWTVQIGGNPAANDTFTVGPNLNPASDSRNGILIAGLQTSNTLNNGTSSIQGAFAQLVSSVGNQAAAVKATSDAANTQLTNATNTQQSVSGVNLDEEATNLNKYQQAYQAAAKVMSTADTLFTSLLADLSVG